MSKCRGLYSIFRGYLLSFVRKLCGTDKLAKIASSLNEQNCYIMAKLDMLEVKMQSVQNAQVFDDAYAIYKELNRNNEELSHFNKEKFDSLIIISQCFHESTARYLSLVSRRGLFQDKWLVTTPEGRTYFDVNGVKITSQIPDVYRYGFSVFFFIFQRTLLVHAFFDDNYDRFIVEALDRRMGEGARCYKDGDFEVTVKPGDIVIDAGAWVGDFSAYAAYKGATVYAFEPSTETYQQLCDTAMLNEGKIHPVQEALNSVVGEVSFLIDENSAGNKIVTAHDKNVSMEKLSSTTLDAFVQKNNISRVDFIKADIQGAERDMLKGATCVLQKFAPRIAIATDHLPDDPSVLAEIILAANPNYKIVQLRTMLFAAVVEK